MTDYSPAIAGWQICENIPAREWERQEILKKGIPRQEGRAKMMQESDNSRIFVHSVFPPMEETLYSRICLVFLDVTEMYKCHVSPSLIQSYVVRAKPRRHQCVLNTFRLHSHTAIKCDLNLI